MRKALPWIYLLLAVLGAILPWKANLEFIAESGGQAFDLARFIADASSTAASRSLSADLLVASAVRCGSVWKATSEDQRLVAGHHLSFGVAFAALLRFLVPAGTAASGSGIGIHILSDHVNGEVTGGRGGAAALAGYLQHWRRACHRRHKRHPLQTSGTAGGTADHPDCKSFQPIQPRPERINGSAKEPATHHRRDQARDDRQRLAAAVTHNCNPQRCWWSIHGLRRKRSVESASQS